MWSNNGSGITFPPDSGITVGGSSSIQLLVLQVHYIDNSKITSSGDSSGVEVLYHTNVKPQYNVGIFSLHNHGIAQANGLSYWESACQLPIDQKQALIPFAYLTHTHSLGIYSGGWRVRDSKWALIGEANPQVHLLIFLNKTK